MSSSRSRASGIHLIGEGWPIKEYKFEHYPNENTFVDRRTQWFSCLFSSHLFQNNYTLTWYFYSCEWHLRYYALFIYYVINRISEFLFYCHFLDSRVHLQISRFCLNLLTSHYPSTSTLCQLVFEISCLFTKLLSLKHKVKCKQITYQGEIRNGIRNTKDPQSNRHSSWNHI